MSYLIQELIYWWTAWSFRLGCSFTQIVCVSLQREVEVTRVVDFSRAYANSVLAMQSFLKLFLIALLFFIFHSSLWTCRRRSGESVLCHLWKIGPKVVYPFIRHSETEFGVVISLLSITHFNSSPLIAIYWTELRITKSLFGRSRGGFHMLMFKKGRILILCLTVFFFENGAV